MTIDAAPQLDRRVAELCQYVTSVTGSVAPQLIGDCRGRITSWTARSVGTLAGSVPSTVVMLLLALGFVVLGLIEVDDFATKLRGSLPNGVLAIDVIREIATRVRQHLVALTMTSAVSGVATGALLGAIGLELAAMWGVLTFLLNYVPAVGPAVAVIPPTLYALAQFDEPPRVLAVLGGVSAIQVIMGNFIDPKIEGRVLSLSPVVVLLAVTFWGWRWGVFGAVLAVPIVVAVVAACDRFESTRWLAVLGSGVEAKGRGAGAQPYGR